MKISTETKVGLFAIVAVGIFVYMTFHIGVFRFNANSYRKQKVFFADVSGLAKKADVKIAGVKVGWVSKIDLAANGDGRGYNACAEIMVGKEYVLHEDAYAVVRQDGLLGVKFLEIVPGDPLSPKLSHGAALGKSGQPGAAIDEIMHQFKMVASNLNEITHSVKDSLFSQNGKARMADIMQDVHIAAQRIANFTTSIDRIMVSREDDIQGIIKDVRIVAAEMKETLPLVREDIHRLTSKLTDETLPGFSKGVEKIAQVFDGDFGNVARKLEVALDSLEEAALQTRDGFRSIGSVADKINDGKGLVGKLVNDDQAYNDLKVAVQGVRNYFSKAESLAIVVDSHLESMYCPAENFDMKDSKGYFDVRVHTNDEHFYTVQLMGTTKGKIKRTTTNKVYKDEKGNILSQEELFAKLGDDDQWQRFAYAPKVESTILERDATKYGFQFGKIFNDVALRFGLFENSFGCALDYSIPFDNDDLRWVTSLEMFDLRGRDRLDDQRPHLKWINRIFILRNIYFNFGADDFISRHNANAFFGVGLRFADDDLKYFLARFGVGSTGMS